MHGEAGSLEHLTPTLWISEGERGGDTVSQVEQQVPPDVEQSVQPRCGSVLDDQQPMPDHPGRLGHETLLVLPFRHVVQNEKHDRRIE
jgi:hypothetical protein